MINECRKWFENSCGFLQHLRPEAQSFFLFWVIYQLWKWAVHLKRAASVVISHSAAVNLLIRCPWAGEQEDYTGVYTVNILVSILVNILVFILVNTTIVNTNIVLLTVLYWHCRLHEQDHCMQCWTSQTHVIIIWVWVGQKS